MKIFAGEFSPVTQSIQLYIFREFLEFKRIVRRFKDCIKTGDGIRAKKSKYPSAQVSYLENVF